MLQKNSRQNNTFDELTVKQENFKFAVTTKLDGFETELSKWENRVKYLENKD
jgi:hypothetical protein